MIFTHNSRMMDCKLAWLKRPGVRGGGPPPPQMGVGGAEPPHLQTQCSHEGLHMLRKALHGLTKQGSAAPALICQPNARMMGLQKTHILRVKLARPKRWAVGGGGAQQPPPLCKHMLACWSSKTFICVEASSARLKRWGAGGGGQPLPQLANTMLA